MSQLTSQQIMERGRGEYFESQSGLTINEGKAYRAGFDYAAEHLVPQPIQPTMVLEEVIVKIRMGDYAASRESRTADVNRMALMEERARQRAQFQADALNATGLAGHPKAQGIFDYAYSEGHAYGLEQVLNTLSDLAEVLL